MSQEKEITEFVFKFCAAALLVAGIAVSLLLVADDSISRTKLNYSAFYLNPGSYQPKLSSDGKAVFELVLENHEGSGQEYFISLKANGMLLKQKDVFVEKGARQEIPIELAISQEFIKSTCRSAECQIRIDSVATKEDGTTQTVFFWASPQQ
jgi:hypothetical protein